MTSTKTEPFTCPLCGRRRKMGASLYHPMCASIVAFERKHGGRPFYCHSRNEARDFRKLNVNRNPKIIDAGKGKTHDGSEHFIPGGTRWAVVLMGN